MKHFIFLPQRKTLRNVSEDACCQVLRKMVFLSTSVEVVRKKGTMEKSPDSFLVPSRSGFHT